MPRQMADKINWISISHEVYLMVCLGYIVNGYDVSPNIFKSDADINITIDMQA
jgi:hypothetical protein